MGCPLDSVPRSDRSKNQLSGNTRKIELIQYS